MSDKLYSELLELINLAEIDQNKQSELTAAFKNMAEVFKIQVGSLEELQRNFLTLETLLDTTKEAVFSFKPGGAFDRMNSAGAKLIELDEVPSESVTAEQTLPALLKLLDKPEQFLVELDKISEDQRLAISGLISFKDGREFEYYSLPKIRDDEYLGRVWCWRDITEIRQKDAQLEHLAFHDSLTNLPNKALMMETLEQAVSRAKRSDRNGAVFFIDLDDFKKINDTAGHKQGDTFLVSVAKRIKQCIRESDSLGRIGGDEFLLIIEDIDNVESVKETFNRILESLKKPLDLGGFRYYVSCSIGISQFPIDSYDPDELIRQADMAMYQAKQSGKNTYCFFHPRMSNQAIDALNIENSLRKAIKSEELLLYFQPEIDLDNNEILGLEALLRWPKSDGGFVEPGKFIGVAESSRLIHDLTEFAIEQSCRAIKELNKTKLSGLPISVNLSVKDLQLPDFTAKVIKILKRHNVSGKSLIFEITETIFMEGIGAISQVVNDLKNYGVRFAIDDFGTGFSSFRYLQLIDIDYIKIDKSFIHMVEEAPQQAAIVKSIIDVGLNLNATLIAEGVETPAEMAFIKNTKCHLVQGNIISPPVPLRDILKMYG